MEKLLVTSLLVAIISAGFVFADTPKPFPEFSAKRIKPPSSKANNRINIQIDPAPIEAPSDTVAEQSGDDKPATRRSAAQYEWFWEEISPDLSQSGPGRLDLAARALAKSSTKVTSPRLQAMQEIAKAQGIEILKSTIGTNVSPALVLAVMTIESMGDPNAVSGAGAQGLMQLMPATAERFGVSDSLAPAENIAGGVKYLSWLMGEFENDPILVLAGYNAGEGSIRKYSGVPPFAETRDYVPKVLAAYQVAKGLCLTPPELITDGCVFRVLN